MHNISLFGAIWSDFAHLSCHEITICMIRPLTASGFVNSHLYSHPVRGRFGLILGYLDARVWEIATSDCENHCCFANKYYDSLYCEVDQPILWVFFS